MKPILLLIALLLVGCAQGVDTTFNTAGTTNIIRVRGCEYVYDPGNLWSGTGRSGGLCHAGDCDNPIHTTIDTIRVGDVFTVKFSRP